MEGQNQKMNDNRELAIPERSTVPMSSTTATSSAAADKVDDLVAIPGL